MSVAEAETTPLRILDWMADEKRRDDWQHTADLMALIYSAHRGEDDQSLTSDNFNRSLDPSERPKPVKGSIHNLKSLLTEKERKRVQELERKKKEQEKSDGD